METDISLLHTEINNVKEEIKTNTEKINEKLRVHTEFINQKLRGLEGTRGQHKIYVRKIRRTKIRAKDVRKSNNHLKEENALLNSIIKNVRLKLEGVKEKENENAQYVISSFMPELSNVPVQDKNENSVGIVCKVAERAKIDNFHRNQIDVAHQASKNKTFISRRRKLVRFM